MPRGLWMLHAVLMERRGEPAAGWESYWNSLAFEIQENCGTVNFRGLGGVTGSVDSGKRTA